MKKKLLSAERDGNDRHALWVCVFEYTGPDGISTQRAYLSDTHYKIYQYEQKLVEAGADQEDIEELKSLVWNDAMDSAALEAAGPDA
tara:strand:+ start:1285 stop:1545 length:261 start_codon:yes stop_codon:yes gene_type:complete